jgi:hypothetical protein
MHYGHSIKYRYYFIDGIFIPGRYKTRVGKRADSALSVMRMGLARARLFFKMKRKKQREMAEKIKESFIGKHPYTRDKNCFFK